MVSTKTERVERQAITPNASEMTPGSNLKMSRIVVMSPTMSS